MRKQKVFNRVSAWLLVWTMVLSALAGNVTVRAEEPEEVDVQIEADTDVQTEEDADMQIEANQGLEDEEGVDEPEEYDGPTGLVAYTIIDRDEDGKITGKNSEAGPDPDARMDLDGATWYLAEIDENGKDTPFNGSLAVAEQSENEWVEVKADNNTYEFSQAYDDELAKDVDKEGYIRFRFKETGCYHIYEEGISIKHDEEDNCIKVTVCYPSFGFYTNTNPEKLSEAYLDGQYEYQPGEIVYVIINPDNGPDDEKVSLEDYIDDEGDLIQESGIFLERGDFSEAEWEEMVEKNDDNDAAYAYKITIPDDCQENFALTVKVTSTDDEGNKPSPVNKYLELNCAPEGLNIVWPWGAEGYESFNEIVEGQEDQEDPDYACKSTIGELPEQHIYLCTKDKEGNPTQITDGEGIELSYKEGDKYISIADGNKETYGSIELCNDEEHGHADKEGMFCFTPEKEGVYKITYKGSFAIFKVRCPDFGFYKEAVVSAENHLGYEFNYYSKDGDIRTFYLLKRDGVTSELIDVRAVWEGKDKTEAFIDKEEVENGWKIMIKPGCQQDFELIAYIQNEDEDEYEESIWLCYDEKLPSSPYYDGQPEMAFSGCMLTEWGYQSDLPIWEKGCMPDEQYWVHGDTAQEVLDKLTTSVSEAYDEEGNKVNVSIEPTGYYFITMSCYTGNADGEAKQKKEQVVTLSDDVKGVVMASGAEPERAWESKDTDFVAYRCGLVYDIDGTYACYLDFGKDSDVAAGWYEVTQADNGVYVYNSNKPVTKDKMGDSVPALDSDGWDPDKYQTVEKYFNWPNLVLDATTGHVPVKLDGQWADGAGVTVKCKCKVDFSLEACGEKITQEDAHKNPHEVIGTTVTFNFDKTEVRDKKEATCTEDGYTGDTYCTVCGKKIETGESIPAIGHSTQTEVKDAKKATCTVPGYTGDTYCTVCDKKIETGTAIPATGHKWDAGAVTKEATETEKGIKTYTCQNGCGETKTEEIPLLEKQPDPTPEQPEPQPQGTKIEDEKGGDTFKVTSDPQASEPTVEYTAPKKGAKGTVKVPDSVTKDGVDYKVTAIADNAFKGNKKITKVTVGKNITSIGKNAFSGCTKLKTVTVGSNVTKIGDSAFKGCAAMTKVTLPAKVEKIGKNAFANCKKLKTITIKSTKLTDKNVSKGAFKGLTAKTTIKVPKSKLKAYKTLFKKKGLSKKVKVKA